MCDVKKAFENGKALIPFITCGDPDLETTAEVVRAAVQNGADLIELGIPFSDPTAESAVLMEADQRALAAGATTDKVFELVKELRQEITIPFVFMTYANVVFSYGTERFAQKCADVGVAGVILHDVPFEEKEEFAPICEKSGVEVYYLVNPTN
jgi:tryptophan synthase alpha chain